DVAYAGKKMKKLPSRSASGPPPAPQNAALYELAPAAAASPETGRISPATRPTRSLRAPTPPSRCPRMREALSQVSYCPAGDGPTTPSLTLPPCRQLSD